MELHFSANEKLCRLICLVVTVPPRNGTKCSPNPESSHSPTRIANWYFWPTGSFSVFNSAARLIRPARIRRRISHPAAVTKWRKDSRPSKPSILRGPAAIPALAGLLSRRGHAFRTVLLTRKYPVLVAVVADTNPDCLVAQSQWAGTYEVPREPKSSPSYSGALIYSPALTSLAASPKPTVKTISKRLAQSCAIC